MKAFLVRFESVTKLGTTAKKYTNSIFYDFTVACKKYNASYSMCDFEENIRTSLKMANARINTRRCRQKKQILEKEVPSSKNNKNESDTDDSDFVEVSMPSTGDEFSQTY